MVDVNTADCIRTENVMMGNIVQKEDDEYDDFGKQRGKYKQRTNANTQTNNIKRRFDKQNC